MDLISAWNDIVNSGTTTITGIPTKTVAMLKSRASAYHAIKCRREERERRLKRSGKSYYLGYELYCQAAVYYSNNYLNGQRRQRPLDEDTQAWHDHEMTKLNKRKYYYARKYEKIISDAKSSLSNSNNKPSDDSIIEYLFSLMPKNAFSQVELDIWKKIYEFANTKAQYNIIKRSDRRTKVTKNCTYLEFAAWLINNGTDYSSNDRNFVARMVEYYSNSETTVSAKKVDELLRYYGEEKYFGKDDLSVLGLNTKATVNDFFTALNNIYNTRKKSSR